MTLNEMMEKIREILPDAGIGIGTGWDNEAEIYTGLMLDAGIEIGVGRDGELEIYTGLMLGKKIPNKIPADYTLVKYEEKE